LPPDPLVLEEIQTVCDTFVKKNISLFDAILALKRAHCCVLVLCLVLGGVAGLLDDLLQLPGHEDDQGPQGFPVHHSNFSESALMGESTQLLNAKS